MAISDDSAYWLTRIVLQRALAFIYLVGFVIAYNQFPALCGDNGLEPIKLFLRDSSFWQSPSIFWWSHSDNFLRSIAIVGAVLSAGALVGVTDAFGAGVSVISWFLLWLLYLSFVNVGQTFYSFGWETLLLETGFLAIFLGPARSPPSWIIIWLFRWILFRLMFGAGLIKIRGDQCWRDLTCMFYHYETQPMPNPLSWYFHQLPDIVKKASVLFNHFVELIVPIAFFAPGRWRTVAGILTIIFQVFLIVSGNFSWLNFVSVVLCLSCFDDTFYGRFLPFDPQKWTLVSGIPPVVINSVAALICFLSLRPALNLLSSQQMMNTSFEPFHLVNTYGAFGSITRERFEVIIEGTADEKVTLETKWLPYEFRGKVGDPARRPPQISPYHLHLDWQMWFAAMSPYEYNPWIVNLVAKMLQNDRQVLSLLRENPFSEHPPHFVRAELYLYHLAPPNHDGLWWTRKRVSTYLPPLSLDDPSFRGLLHQQGWD